MAYKGYLLKLGDYTFPMKYIAESTYSPVYITQDKDSTTLADGTLYRNVLPHQVPKIQFETIDGLNNTQISSIMSNIRKNYISGLAEKKLKASAYMPELDDYVTQDVYLKSDTQFPIAYIENNIIVYDAISFVFTGY